MGDNDLEAIRERAKAQALKILPFCSGQEIALAEIWHQMLLEGLGCTETDKDFNALVVEFGLTAFVGRFAEVERLEADALGRMDALATLPAERIFQDPPASHGMIQ